MLSIFVRNPPSDWSSLPPSLKTFVVAVEFLLHRFALPESDSSRGIIHLSLSAAVEWIYNQTFTPQDSPAVIKVLEDIILEYSRATTEQAVLRYYRGISALYYHLSFRLLLVHPWFSDECPADDTCLMLANLLAHHVPAAYAVFLVNRCLEFFGNRLFDVASTSVIGQYVAHIDHLHEPHNLFLACTILALRTSGDILTDRHAVYTDITRLLRLRTQDPAWDQCRTKLRDLVGKDGAGFFAQHRIWQIGALCEMTVQEIQVAQDRIKYVVEVVDGFFDGGVDISVTYDSTRPLIGRVLGWHFGRKPPGKSEQGQQV
ncbi:hypothetical protein IW261DRAFT_1610372 [Armillaria novae-zelandiae]|uniref:Uncharacterized protein n=1 Tax=Armillaria novae-zelandiae TaxID=153914 RepID=A0AA39P0K3_9AGAR|nr:hypothetical protein IW261DRAFT_1610372 [Armillaria novae-zelandiae]